MKYLGIDYGQKRIGLATSDEEGRLAFPLKVVEAGPEALSEIDALIKKEKIETVVLGESRDLKGQPNAVQEDIEQFKADLEELSRVAVVYQPEYLTSAQALRQAQGKPLRTDRSEPAAKIKDLDASAAALILQSFLDTLKR